MDDDGLHGFGSGGKELQYGGHVSVFTRERLPLAATTSSSVSLVCESGRHLTMDGRRRRLLVWPVPEMPTIFDLALFDGFHGKYSARDRSRSVRRW